MTDALWEGKGGRGWDCHCTDKSSSSKKFSYANEWKVKAPVCRQRRSHPFSVPFLIFCFSAYKFRASHNRKPLERCSYTYSTSLARESGSARVPVNQTRLCVGRHGPGSAESGSARYWLVRVWVVPSVSTRSHTQTVWVLSLKTIYIVFHV
jgi:hypothetical protein